MEIALKEFPRLSDQQIAEVCAVGHPMVGRIREDQLEHCSSSERIGADGKTRKLPVRQEPARVPVETVERDLGACAS